MDITHDFLKHSIEMARSIHAAAIIVYADVFSNIGELDRFLEHSETMPG